MGVGFAAFGLGFTAFGFETFAFAAFGFPDRAPADWRFAAFPAGRDRWVRFAVRFAPFLTPLLAEAIFVTDVARFGNSSVKQATYTCNVCQLNRKPTSPPSSAHRS